MLDFIIWDFNPELFSIGSLAPRWYGPLFILGFFVGQFIIDKIYKLEGKPLKDVETLTIYMLIATVAGARLGHCLFYDFEYYSAHPIEILYVWQGGLASHGAGIAILFAIWHYSKKRPDQNFLYVMDRVAIIVALAGCFIRLGNLTNSEIIGLPANVKQGFVFVNSTTSYLKTYINEGLNAEVTDLKVVQNGTDSTMNAIYLTGVDIKFNIKTIGNTDIQELVQGNMVAALKMSPEYGQHIVMGENPSVFVGETGRNGTSVIIKGWGIPRHPSQLYESITCLLLFGLLLFIYSRKKGDTPEGLLFGIFMVWVFTLRFFYEFIKESQVAFEDEMTLNMGQILSIPMVLIGVFVLVRSLKKNNKS